MNTSWPRAIDSRAALRAFSVVARRSAAACVHVAAHREHVARGVVAEHAGIARGEIARPERRRAVGFDQAAGVAAARPAPMYTCRSNSTMRAICAALSAPAICRWFVAASPACTASVGARASDIRFMLVGRPVSGSRRRRHAVLADERRRRRSSGASCTSCWPPGAGGGTPRSSASRCSARSADPCCSRVGSRTTSIVNSGSIARAVGTLRRPRQRDAEQAALEQQRMRPRIVRRQIRTVHAVHGRKQRILAAGRRPALADAAHRQRHAVGRLVAGDARAAVRADRLEERMPLRVERTGRVQHADLPAIVVVRRERRQRRPLARRPPRAGRTRLRRRRGRSDTTAITPATTAMTERAAVRARRLVVGRIM